MMTSAHLIQWIEHPETLDKDSLYELRMLLARYPYFQSLRMLYLKNLYLLHDASFGEELRKSVLYIADRSKLFYEVEGNRYALRAHQQVGVPVGAEEEAGSDRTLYLIDSFLATMPEEQAQAPELDYAMDYTAYLLNPKEQPVSVEETGTDVPQLRGQSLIDDFLNQAEMPMEECMLHPMEETPEEKLEETPENIAVEEVEEPVAESVKAVEVTLAADEVQEEDEEEISEEIPAEDETFTETLAKIYIKQHRYEKALEIIKKLSLNYPKKNAYFADQIRFLEKLIINAKSK